MSITTILIVILILMLIGALPSWPYSQGWGPYPSGVIGVIVVVLLVLLLTGEALMSLSFIFWLVMFLWLFSWLFYWQAGQQYPWAIHANALIFFILLFLLGWKVFGFAIQGA